MARKRIIALLTCGAFLTTGCASMQSGSTRGLFDDANWTCIILGGLLGGVAGGVAANPNHGDDDEDDARVGAGIGVVVGALIGNWVCGSRENQPPTANLTADPSSGNAPLGVSFRGAGHDPDGEIVAYHWDFGDGSTADTQHASHTYREPGTYTATLTVTDDRGATGSASRTITARGAAAQPSESRRIVLRGINFAFDSAKIEPEFEPVLDVAVEELQANPGVNIEVSGHTDATGADEYNQGLSERRANSVVEYLVGKGVSASRLQAVGHGESSPVADNATRDGRAQNRRVELNVK
jgi:OOP family OmpA-OmpF porin